MPLGAFSEFPYVEKKTNLETGDTIFLLTDGLAEQFNSEEILFGHPRVKEIFELNGNKSPKKIIEEFNNSVMTWKAERSQNDDITMMVIKKTN
jgi:sigma-B regulation protein RsbU (phosphoserine phosphatase)